jgi:hypothetical protein
MHSTNIKQSRSGTVHHIQFEKGERGVMKYILLEQNKVSIMNDEPTPIHDTTILLGLLEKCSRKSVRSTFPNFEVHL